MELTCLDSHEQLRHVADGTHLWAASPYGPRWGNPYTKGYGDSFYDWHTKRDVPAEEITLPVFALPPTPTPEQTGEPS